MGTRPSVDQTVALIDARVVLAFYLEREQWWGREDEYGSAHVPTLWRQVEGLNRAFPDPFADLEDPLVALAEGC